MASDEKPWLTNETVSMTDAEMREALAGMPDLLRKGGPKVLINSSTADGSIPLRDASLPPGVIPGSPPAHDF